MKRCVLILAALLLTACAVAQEAPKEAPAKAPAAIAAGKVEHGKVERINETWVVSVWGTPKQMGNAYGTLLGPVIKRVISDLIHNGFGKEEEAYANIRRGSRTMAEHQPKEFIAELRACAEAAKVDLDDLLMLQYFGDVRRAIKGPGASFLCTSFAIMPPWTRGKRCIVGRNLDYFDHGVGNYASILAHYRPTGRIPFVTVTWVGVANGWTLLNEKGIVCSNNTALGDGKHSLEGISTCYLLRVVAENAAELDWRYLGVILAARAGSVYAAVFQRRGGRIVPAAGPGTQQADEFLAQAPRPIMLIGEGLAYQAMGAPGVTASDPAADELHLPAPQALWRVGHDMARAGMFTDYHHLLPIYPRQCEAVRQWEARARRQDPQGP